MKRWVLVVGFIGLAIAIALEVIDAQAPRQGGPPRPVRTGQRGMPLDLRSPDNINWNLIQYPTQRFADRDKEAKDPVKLFDNLYSVGAESVSSFLITTSDGLVLVDTTFPETVDMVLDNIRKVGLDPANIKYVFSTHAAQDHYGGAGRIKQVAPAARIGMGGPDWDEVEGQIKTATAQPNSRLVPFTRDLVITDGQTIRLGDTTLKFYVLPGRTSGAIGIEYQVRDGGRTYRAFHTGAYGTPSVRSGDAFVKSIARIKSLGPWQVFLPNHPFMALPRDLAEIEAALARRRPGDPHPAVITDPKIVDRELDFIHELISRKIAIERYQGIS